MKGSAEDVLPGAGPRIGQLQPARILLGRRDHIVRRRVGKILVGDQRVGDVEHQRDRNEVGERVIGQLLIEPGVEHDVAQAAHEQGITIGRRIDHRLRADDGPRAGPVLHHDALAQPLRELVREQPPDDVIAARSVRSAR
jgi:hypothetical protein